MILRLIILVLLLLTWAPAAAAQVVRLGNNEGQGDTTFNAADKIAWVSMMGASSAFVQIPSAGTGVMTLKPVICLKPVCALADWLEDKAWFVLGTGQPQSTIALTDPNVATEAQIITALPALFVGVKVDLFTSGSTTGVKMWSVVGQATQYVMAILPNGQAVYLPAQDISGTKTIAVSIPHVVTAQGFNRQSCSLVIDAINETSPVNGAGAGQITADVPTGRTGNTVFEARIGTGTWFGTPFRRRDGTAIQAGEEVGTYPIQGHFEHSGYDEYRVRAATHTSGTHTPCLTVSPGAGLVRTTQGDTTATCYLPTAASTNSTNCKTAIGSVYTIRAINTTATKVYLRMYNLSAAPTCSSATGFIETIPVPASADGSGFVINQSIGQHYSAGIGFCVTGGGSSTDNTNAVAGVYITILYK